MALRTEDRGERQRMLSGFPVVLSLVLLFGVAPTTVQATLIPNDRPRSDLGDVSLGYNSTTGEVWLDAPTSCNLASIDITSASGIFANHAAVHNLGGSSFDEHSETLIFKAVFGDSFGSLSFGEIAEPGLSEDLLVADLSVFGTGLNCDPNWRSTSLVFTSVPPLASRGSVGDGTTSIVYDAFTGEVSVDVPPQIGVNWIAIFSSGHVFTGEAPRLGLRRAGHDTPLTLMSLRMKNASYLKRRQLQRSFDLQGAHVPRFVANANRLVGWRDRANQY